MAIETVEQDKLDYQGYRTYHIDIGTEYVVEKKVRYCASPANQESHDGTESSRHDSQYESDSSPLHHQPEIIHCECVGHVFALPLKKYLAAICASTIASFATTRYRQAATK